MKAILQGARWETDKAAELVRLLADSRILLVCGVLASVVYVAAHVVVPMWYPGYSSVDQTVSELSAIGAPTRDLWAMMMVPFVVFLIAFGVGVWWNSDLGIRNSDFDSGASDRESVSRRLRVVGALLVVQAVVGFVWPPMHMRGVETTLTDTLHVAFVLLVVPLMVVEIWFSRAVVGRTYAVVTLIALIAFGVVTAFYGPDIPRNLPTPWVGVWERISIGAWALWLMVLSVKLIRR